MADEIISKAAILEKQNEPLMVDLIEVPNSLEVGQVLVRVHASAICGSQIGEISGAAGPDPYLPHLLGHEGGGIVEKTGPGVTSVKTGDRVVMHWRKGPGIEATCPKYRRNNGTWVGGGRITTFNTYAVVSENRLTAIADDIPFDIAALMGCSVTTGLGIINHETQLKMGQSVAVFGCGGVGLNVVQGAVLRGAHPIFGIDIHSKKRRMASAIGAYTFSLYPNQRSWRGLVDIAVDCTGIPEVIAQAFDITAPGGRLILAGLPSYEHVLTLRNLRKHFTGKTIVFSEGGRTNPAADIPRYLQLYREGKLKLNEVITHHCLLNDINDAIELFKIGEDGKIIIKME